MIKRYDSGIECAEGSEVLYSDHAAHVARLESRVKELEAFVEQVAYREEFRELSDYATRLEIECRAIALLPEALARPQESEPQCNCACEQFKGVHHESCATNTEPPPAKSEFDRKQLSFELDKFLASNEVNQEDFVYSGFGPHEVILDFIELQLSKQPTEKSDDARLLRKAFAELLLYWTGVDTETDESLQGHVIEESKKIILKHMPRERTGGVK